METQEIICRLCLKICESFKALEGNMKDFLDKLLPKINSVTVQKPVVCTNCAELLKKCFHFKEMCFNAHGNIIPFVNNKDAVKLNLIDVPLSRNENVTGVSEDQDVCGFCMSPLKNCSVLSFDVKEGDVMLEKMIEKCLPELDLSKNKMRVICTPCYGSLEIYFHFVTNCLAVEEKIKNYCETVDIGSRDQIELSQILRFTINDVTSETDGISADIIKVEEQLYEKIKYAENREIGKGCAIKSEPMSCDDSEGVKVEVEHETKCYMDMTVLKFNNEEQLTPKNMMACKEESDSPDIIKIEETFHGEIKIKEMEDQKLLTYEEIEIKMDCNDFDRFEHSIVSSHPEIPSRSLMSRECSVLNLEGNLSESNNQHTLTKKHVSKVRMYQCDSCSYQTTFEVNFKRHLLVHKDPSEVTMYKYDSSSYQTKHKGNLKEHLLLPNNPSEVTIYKCGSCSFQSKHRETLQKHLLIHASETKIYKCDFCSFQTKQKCHLIRHLLRHKDPSEVPVYKCNSCLFQTKYRTSLKLHLLMHKDPSEIIMYKCDSCSYQTRHKGNLKEHLLVHKDPSEITMYKCDCCSYQTNYKNTLKKHLLVHKDPSEVTMYKCDSCSHQTKHKGNLKEHLLVHKDPSEVIMYKCDSCSYQTKNKWNLKDHLLIHAPEAKLYKCDSCFYQTNYKKHYKIHLLVHKDPSEVTMYKCDACSYQTKRKWDLKQHRLRLHKNSSEITT